MIAGPLLESALEGEITDHLGYDKHDPAGKNGGNSRNGEQSKAVPTGVGPAEIRVAVVTAVAVLVPARVCGQSTGFTTGR